MLNTVARERFPKGATPQPDYTPDGLLTATSIESFERKTGSAARRN
jgi:hypothetical protein